MVVCYRKLRYPFKVLYALTLTKHVTIREAHTRRTPNCIRKTENTFCGTWICGIPLPKFWEQEAQLPQTDCAMLRVIEYFAKSIKVTQGHSKWHSSVGRKSLLVFHCNYMYVSRTASEIFNVKEWCDLENWVRGCSRSLKMAPFDRPCTAFYWSVIVRIALSFTIFELFDVE